MIALQNWIAAVNNHTPGRPDASVKTVAALSYQTRKDLNAGLELFFSALRSEKVAIDGYGKRIVDIGTLVRERPGTDVFLRRAVVLHSDAAAYEDLYEVQPTGPASASRARPKKLEIDPHGGMPMSLHGGERVPPLLTNNRIVLDKDGQILGEMAASWNWPFARGLLDQLDLTKPAYAAFVGTCRGAECLGAGSGAPKPAPDPFAGAWCHATTAYMFASGLYGDATPHLQRAADVLPNDARVLFDRACYAEILGLPMHQVLSSDAFRRSSGAPLGQWMGTDLRIPSAEQTNAEAERLFRRALEVDPSFVEARVRLARLLDLHKRHEEAAAELKTALAAKPTGDVAFYAHLFAGRTAQALHRNDEAAHHYDEAAALFPDAQSALLGRSQVALLESDVPATLAPVQRLRDRSSEFTADPWWQYHLGAGRDADALLREVWASVPR